MHGPKIDDDKLQMLFDGELAPDEEAAVRRGLEGSPEGLAQLREWEQLREAMQAASADWAGAIDSDGLFARIEAEIAAPEVPVDPVVKPAPSEPPVLRVVPGGRERRIWGAAATGFAAAAAISLAVVSWPKEAPGPQAPTARGSEVLEVDFGSNTGTIFEVEGSTGVSVAVVWIDDEEVAIP